MVAEVIPEVVVSEVTTPTATEDPPAATPAPLLTDNMTGIRSADLRIMKAVQMGVPRSSAGTASSWDIRPRTAGDLQQCRACITSAK